MELLKLIFYKIYCWQRRFGSGYTLFDTILGITVLLYPITMGSFFYIDYFFGKEYFEFLASPNASIYGIALGILANIFLFIVLSYNKTYLKILLQMHRKYKDKYKWLVLLLIIGSFLYFILAGYLAVEKYINLQI